MFKINLFLLTVVSCLFFYPAVSDGWGKYIIEEPVFLKVNIHYVEYKDENKASYANWTDPGKGHKILPVNSPVKIKKWGRKGFKIINIKNDMEILFAYHEPRMQMPIEEYLSHITSLSEIDLEKLSDEDRAGIKKGRASIGMTKNGVMIALGYPATYRTLSLEKNIWIYWTNRHKTLIVKFDQNGIVTAVGGEKHFLNHVM